MSTFTKARPVEPVRWQYPYDPTGNPKQIRFHSVKAKEKLYGGSAGSGKSESMIAETLGIVLQFGVPGLILRRTTTAMGEITQRLLLRIPPEIGRWNEQKKTWYFRNGGRLILGYLERDSDVQRYAGNEYGIIAWDELTQFTEWQYLRMLHPLRVAKSHPGYAAMNAAGIEPYFIAGTNPGSSGHLWVKSRFVDPAPWGTVWRPRASLEEPNPGTRVFIPATVWDNPHMPEEYINQLRSLPEAERRMLLDGDWDVYSGQYFSGFRREIHVIKPEQCPIPLGGVEKAQGIDFGVSNPFACLWGAIMADGQLVIYRELYKAGVVAERQPSLILEQEQAGEREPGRPIVPFLDPAAWQREANSPVPESPNVPPRESAAWWYGKGGLPCRKADNRRVIGWQEIARLLEVNPVTGKPGIVFYETCVDTIRTLPTLPRDSVNPEDIDTKSEDHLADALRYLAMGVKRVPAHESKGRDALRKINQASTMAASTTYRTGAWRT